MRGRGERWTEGNKEGRAGKERGMVRNEGTKERWKKRKLGKRKKNKGIPGLFYCEDFTDSRSNSHSA